MKKAVIIAFLAVVMLIPCAYAFEFKLSANQQKVMDDIKVFDEAIESLETEISKADKAAKIKYKNLQAEEYNKKGNALYIF